MGLRSCSRSQTLSPNSAPRSIPLPRGTPPASVEKPEPTTPPRHSAGGDTPRLVLPACPCHSGPLKYLGFPSAGTRRQRCKAAGPRPAASAPRAASLRGCGWALCRAPSNWASTYQTAGSQDPKKRYFPTVSAAPLDLAFPSLGGSRFRRKGCSSSSPLPAFDPPFLEQATKGKESISRASRDVSLWLCQENQPMPFPPLRQRRGSASPARLRDEARGPSGSPGGADALPP